MQRVFVLDAEKRPLMPCRPARARLLLTQHRAAVFRYAPFTIILGEARPELVVTPLRLKIDPGSITTGLAVLHEASGEVVWAAELTHQGHAVHLKLQKRHAQRRNRRSRKTRYRAARFLNRRRRDGWLPPSLESRISNIVCWVERLRRLCPIGALSQELVRFDTQLMQHPEISGVEYQQGTLAGFELREYVLEKFGRHCVYCDKTRVPLQLDHLLPRSRRGPTLASNLAPACKRCNQKKGNRTAAEFGHPEVEVRAKVLLRDAAAVNSSRWALYHRLEALGLPLETGSGGRTKWNRHVRGMPKTHWLDAVVVGASTPEQIHWQKAEPLLITALGRHNRQMMHVNKRGFPVGESKATSVVGGFRSGDLVRAVVPEPYNTAGVHVGTISIRATGKCDITTKQRRIGGVSIRYCLQLQRVDGFRYARGSRALPPLAEAGASARLHGDRRVDPATGGKSRRRG
jgi:5-methylcytosine-specific restriction endonuclease McrA